MPGYNITADTYFGDGSQLTGIVSNVNGTNINVLNVNATSVTEGGVNLEDKYEPKSSAGNMVMKFTGGKFYMKVS